jgi:aryl-alcohol dehydrogenase-like predicted oxidoreductase
VPETPASAKSLLRAGTPGARLQERGSICPGFAAHRESRSDESPADGGRGGAAGVTVPQVVFAFARAVGILPLTGTSDPTHMQQDLASASFKLDLALIETIDGLVA